MPKIYITEQAEERGIRRVEAVESTHVRGEYWEYWEGEEFAYYTVGKDCELTLPRAREVVRDRMERRWEELRAETERVAKWLEDEENPKVVEEGEPAE